MQQLPKKGAQKPKRPQDQEPDPKVPAVNSPDTAPEEFAPNAADTDLPIDGEVRNDSVLRGEDHADEKIPPISPTEEKDPDKS